MLGEIGGSAEKETCEYLINERKKGRSKPIAGFIAGRTAVLPAMKPAIGFDLPFLRSFIKYSQVSFSALPPISPNIIIDSVSSSLKNLSITSMNSVPLIGSPPIPIQDDCPSPIFVV